jgi:hypothetical protein
MKKGENSEKKLREWQKGQKKKVKNGHCEQSYCL